ncbi:Bug family tripartite tricarboxylate transporter substrate binding protein [Bordetella petrii]|uniref:Bug family tripartite tricarboxylate transporter substrate binding protein n=1 Tax=Bordetella petrii TaxID=94624 RepID=UPI001E2B033A|nr:tripartite tricarboxylate transporter substrate binding protein [Bordetella petrii]MCD0505770.1 tripartite tricarboxylate transporter substrate binding protein [Bordetella petrii]
MRKFLLHIAAAAACCTLSAPAWSAAYPERPVKLIVPQSPGGASDTLARLVAQGLTQAWGQSVVVENKAGAGGNIGLDAVAKSPGDGYTLLLTYEGTQAINVSLRRLPFDPVKDFTPIAAVATVPFIVTVNKDVKAQTFQEFVELARSHPGMTFGSAGSGTVNHLLGEMVNHVADTQLTHVPYKGAAPALGDLLGGRLDAVFTSVPSISQQVESGSVRALAISSKSRSSRFPDLPTIAESGYPDFDVSPWFAIFGPAGIPGDVVDKINRDVAALLADPGFRRNLAEQAAEPLQTSPEQLKSMLQADITKWAAVVEKSGARVD